MRPQDRNISKSARDPAPLRLFRGVGGDARRVLARLAVRLPSWPRIVQRRRSRLLSPTPAPIGRGPAPARD
ncbi:hypothetical protein ACRAWD_11530 [Caulobacter segnis]